jgi:NTP pyrophosphatase (non-canonical NTP hydrolase)
MTIEKLEQAVIRWANDRDLYRYSTDVTRLKKMAEEFEELEEAVMNDQADDIILEAGDVLVTIINLLHPMGLDMETCLKAAYEKIKDRKGKMVNGTFKKEE